MLIRWTKPAIADLTHICDYAREHFGSNQTRRTAIAIYNAAESLQAYPNRGRLGRKSGTREMVIPNLPFLVIYRVREDAIEVVRVLHGAQKWP